jgi:hypothetical protein
MSTAARQSERIEVNLDPAAWLIAPTLSLLFGQAVATAPWPVPTAAIALSFLPLCFITSSRWRLRAILVLLSFAGFAVGYLRHRQLLDTEFPPHHLRSVMEGEERLLLEGRLRLEPEKWLNRNRWLLRAERVWHPTGAEDVTGDILIGLRTMRRDWRFGDRVRFWIRPVVPRNSGNPGGFNYASYLARSRIRCLASSKICADRSDGTWSAIFPRTMPLLSKHW